MSAEDTLAFHLKATDIPFEREFRYAKPRRFRADFALPTYQLLVEVQGGIFSRQAHGSIKGILADIDRLNHAALNGWRMLRFTPGQVEDGTALTMIEKAIGR